MENEGFKIQMIKKLAYIILLLGGFVNPASGQRITPDNSHVSRENWLPNRTINAIFQDSEGLLWVGTTNGLYQYDGQKVKHFATQPNKKNAIFTNLVNDISESDNGNIIVALESGLSSYDKRTDTFTTISKKIQHYERAWRDDFDRVWLSLGPLGDIFTDRIEVNRGLNTEPLTTLGEAQSLQLGRASDFETLGENLLLVATKNGLFKLDLLSSKVTKIDLDGEFTVLEKLSGSEFLIGTKNNGLLHVNLDRKDLEVYGRYHFGVKEEEGHDHITSIAKGRKNELLISTSKNLYQGTRERGRLSFSKLINDPEILEDNNIITSYIDETGVYWVGTLRGLYKIKPNVLSSERLRIDVPNYKPLNQHINYLFKENNERYWVGTTDDGFFTLNPVKDTFKKVDFEESVQQVYKSSKGYFLATNHREVFRFESPSTKPILKGLTTSYQGIVTALEVAPGEWWFGCNSDGLFMYDDDGQIQYQNLFSEVNKHCNPVSTIFTMLKDSRDNVWIGSKGDGLLRVNLKSGEIKKYSGIGIEGEISRRILHLKESKDGVLWIATREGGLYVYNHKDDSFKQYTMADGLPSNVVCAVAEDSRQNIIVSTNNGLAIYNRNGLVPFKSFGENDGITFGDFSFKSVIEGAEDYLFFGNSNGLYKVKRNETHTHEDSKFYWSAVVPLSTEVTASPKERKNYLRGLDSTSDLVMLDAEDNNVEISFALLSFSDPSKNAYAYRMKGHVDEWAYILNGEQSVKLFDLSPGKYTFELKAENSIGQQLEGVKTLNFKVLPPFWLSTWALVLYFVVFSFFTLLAFYLFKRWNQLQKKLKEEEALVAIKDQQMVYFADLSHEIKNRLSLILGPLENALSGKKVNQAVLNNLYQQTFRLKRISDQIMDLRKSEGGEFLLQVEKGDIFQSIEKLCQETQPLAIVRDIKLTYNLEEEADEAWFDEELLEIITLNLLNNAIKYTPSGGTVHVKAEMVFLEKNDLPDMAPAEGLYLKCKVSDTGIGIPRNEVKNLFNRFYRASNAKKDKKKKGAGIGLSLVGRLIKKHRGFIDISSEEGDGTRVSFYLPMEQSHFQMNEIKLSGSTIPIIEGQLPAYDKLDTTRSTLLLVDDNVEILSFLEEHLSSDFNIIKNEDGQAAWETVQETSVSLIISDLSMPKMDGLELMRRVKGEEKLRHIPFIILTGRNSHSQKLACIQNGVDDFVDKPFSLELITWRIKALLYNRDLMKNAFSRNINVEPSIEKGISHEEAFIQQVVGFIEENIKSNNLSVEFLAEQCCMSRATFYRKMESLMGSAPSTFIRNYRLKKAAMLLQSGNYYISEVAYQTGFSTPKYFSKCFQKEFGATPSEYVKKLTELSSN